MRPLEAIRSALDDALGRQDPDDKYAAARARAAREKPDRMRFVATPRRRRKPRAAAFWAREERGPE